MTDKRPEETVAALEEKVRLLALENDHLADRAEETLLLGLIAEKINVINDVDELIAMGLEQTAFLKNIPFAACYGYDGRSAHPLHAYRPRLEDDPPIEAVPVPGDLDSALQNGGTFLTGAEVGLFPLGDAGGPGFRPEMTVLLPLQSRFGQQMLFVFATDEDPDRLGAMNFLLPRVVEMVSVRLDNIELLGRLTLMNEHLDQKVNERTRELRASETRIRTLFEGAFDAIFVADGDGVLHDFNNQACRALGYTREELLNIRGRDILPALSPEQIEATSAAAIAGETRILETEHRRKDGSVFPVEVRFGPIEIDGRPMLLAQARDVSERNRLLEQLNQAQKMEAVGRLAGGIAHDFNNILTVIMGHIDLLRMDLAPDGEGPEELRSIQQTAEKAARLTQQLLAFSRKQVLDMQPFDLSGNIRDMSRMLLRMIDESIELEIDLDPQAGLIYGDPGRVEQILLNLAINARDAMPDGGHLRIATTRGPCSGDRPDPLPDGPAGTGGCVTVTVSDTGNGIPADIQDKIFDPFFTTKEVGKGTGLGLAMVYGLAQQHNARLSVESRPGEGATFQVVFPEVQGAQTAPAAKRSGPVPGGTETLLLVEDDPNIRAVLARMIEKLGYGLLTANHGQDALRVIAADGRTVDLVLTDVIMPRMGGGELVKRLKSEWPALKVIFMSGYTDDAVGSRELLSPGTSFLQKPVSYAQLGWEIRKLLDGD